MQTFRLSSSSLSKSIVAHVGHLVQSPSGISRFLVLDLPEPSLSFLVKAGALPVGGVKAGSAISRPRVFLVTLVILVVSMSGRMLLNSKPACNCPNTHLAGTGGPQLPGAGTRRRPGREHVVHQHHAFTVQFHPVADREGSAHVHGALLLGQAGLG